MNLFSKIFGDSEEKNTPESSIDWITLTENSQLDDLSQESFKRPVFIFKHSTRCNISRMVLKQFESHYALSDREISPYFLNLLEYRGISNEIAARFEVIHQSPQLVMIVDGKCVYTASHSDIDAEELKTKVSEQQK